MNERIAWELGLSLQQKKNLLRVQKARQAVRNFLAGNGFVEVDIPVIFPSKSLLYGGIPVSGQIISGYLCAVMTPFIRRWLVLARELDCPRVYFIGKCFRDESVDQDHYPVFENLAIGARGENYRFLMELVENMASHVAKVVEEKGVGRWRHISYSQLKPRYGTATIGDKRALEEYNRLTGAISKPTIVTDLPKNLFGPAKGVSPSTKERAEFFVSGIELGNISSFLSNPTELAKWYQGRGIDFGKYRIEMEHLASVSVLNGEPIATGAIGLSRLYMILLRLGSIKETVAFPYLGGD